MAKISIGRLNNEHEIIWEFCFDFLYLGLALVEIDDTGPKIHYHERTMETYVLLSGVLEVYRGDTNSIVVLDEAGDSVKIPKRVPHKARARGGKARFLVISVPGWSEDDHYVYEGPPIMH